MKKANLVILGAPGSGKGTRASALCGVLKIPQISTGDLFRNNLKNGTDLGKLAKSYMEKGALVPDDVTAAMVEDRLKNPDASNGFILDGFPRTVRQAELLDEILSRRGGKLEAVFFLDVPDAEIVRRISGRRVCEKCQAVYHVSYKPPKIDGVCDACGAKLLTRPDDNPETVLKRLEVFRENTLPLAEFYEKKGLLIRVPAELSERGAEADMLELARRTGLTVGK